MLLKDRNPNINLSYLLFIAVLLNRYLYNLMKL